MAELTSPAKRLADLLELVVKWGDRHATPSTPAQRVWIRAIQVDAGLSEDEEDEEFHKALSAAMSLAVTCEGLVQRTRGINREMHLRQLRKVKHAILRTSSQQWDEFRSSFNNDFMMSLQWAAEDLTTYWHEEVIQDKELECIGVKIGALRNRVVASGLDHELKTILLDGLEEMRWAIFNYQFTGADGIRMAVDSSISTVVRHADDLGRVSDDEDKEVLVAFGELLSILNRTVSVVLKLKALGEGVRRLLSLVGPE